MKSKKHILVVSQYFYPESFRINDICKEWIKRGYKVTVVTGIPNYPEGRFYQGYSWFKKRKESWEGIEIIRIPLVARGHNALGLCLNYISFVISGFLWNIFTRVKADCVFNYEVSPMTQALVGVWYAKKRKIPCYLYVQDLWPENVEVVTGIHSQIILRPIGKMVNYIYEHCERIFATSPSFVKEIQKRCQNRDKVSYLPQYAEEFYHPMDKKNAKGLVPEIPDDNSFKIIFTGNIGQAQGLDLLLNVARKLKDEGIQQRPVRFIVVGNGRNKEAFQEQVQSAKLNDFFLFFDRQPAERIPEFLACCDAAFLSFMDNELFAKTIPAKLQSYMACGMPIAASVSGESERIIMEARCGICSCTGDIDQLAENIKILVKMERDEILLMGKNSREYYVEYFDKMRLMDEMDRYLLEK